MPHTIYNMPDGRLSFIVMHFEYINMYVTYKMQSDIKCGLFWKKFNVAYLEMFSDFRRYSKYFKHSF